MTSRTKAEIVLAGVDNTKAAFASVTKSFDALQTKIGGFAGKAGAIGVGIAGVTGAFAALENIQAIKILDQLDDMAEKTGISVEKLSELRFAGETTGTSFETLAGGVGRLAKQMAAAAGGSKEASATFEALGVEVTNVDGTLRSSDDVLRDVATRFAGYEDGAGKAALAQRLFGKSGAEMIPLLNQGAAGIERLSAEAKALGVIYDGRTAKAAADFNDNLVKIKLSSEAAAVSLAGPFIQSLARVSAEMVEAKKSGTDYLAVLGAIVKYGNPATQIVGLGRMALGIGNDAGKTTKQIQDWVNGRGGPTAGGGRGFVNPQVAAPIIKDDDPKAKSPRGGSSSAKVEKDPEAAAKRYLESLDKQIEKTEKLSQVEIALAEIRRIGLEGGTVTEGMRQQILLKAASVDATKEQAAEEKKLEDQREEAQKRIMAAQDEAAKIFEETRTPLEKYNAEVARLNDLYKQGYVNSDTYNRALEQSSDAFDEAAKRAKDAANQQDEYTQRAAENIQGYLGSSFADILDGNYKDIGSNFSKMLNRMVAEAAAAQLSRHLFGDLVEGGEGSGLAGGLMKSLLGSGGKKKSSYNSDALEDILGKTNAFGTGTGSGTSGSSGAGIWASLGSWVSGLMSFDVGTDYVPRDMIARIHKGEKIVRAADNQSGRSVAQGNTYVTNVSVEGQVDRRTRNQIANDISLDQRRGRRYA